MSSFFPDRVSETASEVEIEHTTARPAQALSLEIAYEAPKRFLQRVVLTPSGSSDSGFDSVDAIRAHHIGALGLEDIGAHIYVNSHGALEWGLALGKKPHFPAGVTDSDLVIMVFGQETSFSPAALHTLRELLPVINAVHGNSLTFTGLRKHHARLGIGPDGKLIAPALQEPLG